MLPGAVEDYEALVRRVVGQFKTTHYPGAAVDKRWPAAVALDPEVALRRTVGGDISLAHEAPACLTGDTLTCHG